MPREAEFKVGLLLVVTLVVAAIGILLVGQQENVFRSKNDYFILFETVSGLSSGSPTQVDGVDVGSVQRVILPEDPGQSQIKVWVQVDTRYAERVRADSQARIKTLGLLGDKYVEITSGSPEMPRIPGRDSGGAGDQRRRAHGVGRRRHGQRHRHHLLPAQHLG